MRRTIVAVMIMLTLLLSLPLSAALVSRYSFNDPNTATTIVDSISGKNGTLVGGAHTAGGQLVLSGVTPVPPATGDYAQLPADILGSSPVSATIEFWFTYTNSGWIRVFDFGNSSGGNGGYYLLYSPCGAGSVFALATKGYPGWQTGEDTARGDAAPAGTRVHVACVYDNAAKQMRLYQNGVLVQASNITQVLSGLQQVNCYLGKSNYGAADALFGGTIDEFRIYDSAAIPQVVLDAQIGTSCDTLQTCTLASMTPNNGDTMVKADPTVFSWTAAAGVTVDHYEAFVKTDPNLLDPNSVAIPAGTPDYSGSATTFSKSGNFVTNYCWRVDTVAVGGTRYPGPRFVFTTAPAVPVVITNPVNGTAKAGESVVYTATFDAPSTYPLTRAIQWFKATPDTEITTVPGVSTITQTVSGTQTTSTLTLLNVSDASIGSYYAKATNAGGATNSTSATLAIKKLTSWFKFNNSLIDSIGGFNGTIDPSNTGVTYTEGHRPGSDPNQTALDLTGNGAVSVPHGLYSFDDITIACWIYYRGGSWTRVFEFGGDNNTIRFVPNTGSAMEYDQFSNWSDMTLQAPPMAMNQWVHWAISKIGTTATMYVDGVAVASRSDFTRKPSDIKPGTEHSYFGRSLFDWDGKFNGKTDDFRIYNYGMSSAEIVGIYTETEPYACSAKIAGDITGDCRVTLEDFAPLAATWLECNRLPASTCN